VTMNHAHASLLDLLAASLCSMMLLAICIVASWIVIQVKGRE